MKQSLISVIITAFLCSLIFNNCASQSLIDTSFYYKHSTFTGEKKFGKKTGKWIEQGPRGVIYSENYFDSIGNPLGIWIINFPDGTKRFETEYSNNEVIRVTVYRKKMRIIDVTANPKIPHNTYVNIRLFEDNMFAGNQTTIIYNTTGENITRRTQLEPFGPDSFDHFIHISGLLRKIKFTGSLIVWNEEGKQRRKYTYSSGKESRLSYFYAGERIKMQDEYSGDTLVRTIKFHKNGSQSERVYKKPGSIRHASNPGTVSELLNKMSD